MIPEELRYTDEHEWVATKADDLVRVGITEYAQQQLGDVVFVQLPEVGDRVEAGAPIGEVESTKSVSDLYAPLSGEVVAVNEATAEQPDLLNDDPYGEGWLFEIRVDDPEALEALLDADAYQALTRA
ncbi:glycine cleavage system protein GcvH [Actinokineospora globicatena]|uniref:glycine cleavage system protein GcvH n=1 Tax=Actinokineospora globicatena TaxID=103729 RepID=UPI0020A565F2|nr:glycine cleavage system protein GcvH [Actinokineospora globicatena]MCP2304642.1 glycine cleavage system H protein [Actinokineospora globicatena]GLW77986.1 glycine cleavage system H protein [Actinokineospora globicatena]GLW85348.1 glycine cleavage system H protein [Actinokineospora globicatena]